MAANIGYPSPNVMSRRTPIPMALSKGRKKLVERLLHPRFRAREGMFVVEGIRASREFLERAGDTAGTRPPSIRFALVSPRCREGKGGRDLLRALEGVGVSTEEVEDRELEALSGTEQPQGVLLVLEEAGGGMEALSEYLEKVDRPRILVLDGVQDPGNAGSLIRSAQAFGLHGAVALDGTVDPFNHKVVRATAGGLAHLPVVRAAWSAFLPWVRDRGIPLLVGDAGGEDVREVPIPDSWALAVGNEGSGPRPELLEEAYRVLGIPMARGVGTLNAGLAGAILLFALAAPGPGGDPDPGTNVED